MRGGHRGNGTRYLLNYCGVNYREETYDCVPNSEWGKNKDSLGLNFPNLPHIVDGDFNITETIAVQEYICMKWKPELLGRTPQEQARIMQLHLICDEKIIKMIMECFKQDDKAVVGKAALDNLEAVYAFLGDNPFLTGNQVCVADFVLFEHTNFAMKLTDREVFERYPKLEAHNNRMRNLPGLKQFLESGKCHDEPYVAPMA